MEWLAILLALAGGFTYALAAVIQQRVAAEQPDELSMSPRLLVALFRRPLWLFGGALDVLAYGFEAAALGVGSVILVGPLLVSGLLFAIPLATFGTGEEITRREMIPAVVVTVGLALFVGVAAPGGGDSQASLEGWVIAGAFVGIVVVGLTVAAQLSRNRGTRALLLGLATGTLYGLTAVLTKSTVDMFDNGVAQTFTHWQPWALLACVFGVTLFHEDFGANSTWEWIVTVLSIIAMVWGTIRLSTSPLVAHEAEEVHHAPIA